MHGTYGIAILHHGFLQGEFHESCLDGESDVQVVDSFHLQAQRLDAKGELENCAFRAPAFAFVSCRLEKTPDHV